MLVCSVLGMMYTDHLRGFAQISPDEVGERYNRRDFLNQHKYFHLLLLLCWYLLMKQPSGANLSFTSSRVGKTPLMIGSHLETRCPIRIIDYYNLKHFNRVYIIKNLQHTSQRFIIQSYCRWHQPSWRETLWWQPKLHEAGLPFKQDGKYLANCVS